MFNNMTNIFMRIPFWWLQACYVAFFDWNAIFRRIGCWLYREEMYVVYNGSCKTCRRTIASLRVFDIFGRVTYANSFDGEAIKSHGLNLQKSNAIMTDVYATVRMRSWYGFRAYRALAMRIPVLWPIWPFLYIWPILKIGTLLYQHVDDLRACDVAKTPFLETKGYGPHQQSSPAVLVVGVFLLFVNILCGLGHIVSSWPFACYPTFERIVGPETKIESLTISMLNSKGETIFLDEQTMSRQLYWTRRLGLTQHILSTDDVQLLRARLKALWKLWSQNNSSLGQANSIRFYKVILFPLPPEQQGVSPTKRELLFELKL